MKKALPLVMTFLVLLSVVADEPPSAESTKRVDTIRYGIEAQVIELLVTLKSEKNDGYKEEIISAFDRSTSPKLKAAILDYLGHMELRDAEQRSAEIVEKRDSLQDALVAAAFQYLLAIKSKNALSEAVEIIEAKEKRYLQAAIKTIGAAGSDAEAEALRKAYEAEGVDQQTKEAIVLALGAMKSAASYDLLASIASSDESTKALRMYACTALGDLADARGVAVLVGASVSQDPNVRASAIAALGNFSSGEAMAAVREGLRDGHVLPRIAAAKAAGKSRDEAAVPYLEFKVSYDPEKAVKEASITALAAIGGSRTDRFLSSYIADAKNAVAYRSAALGAIIAKGGEAARGKAMAAFIAAQSEKDRAVFTGFARAAMAVDDKAAVPFAAVLLGDKDFSMKLGAIAWAERNKARELEATIKTLSDSDPNDAVKKRAAQALDRIGR